jgi:hypothetical protein
MMPYPISMLVAGALVLGFASTAAGGSPPAVDVELEASRYNAGHSGRAALMAQDGRTHLVLQFSGVPPDTTLPVRVYTYIHEGSCDHPKPQPAYELTDDVHVTTAGGRAARSTRGAFSLAHTVPATLDELLSGRYVLLLQAAPADGGRTLFCGPLHRPR